MQTLAERLESRIRANRLLDPPVLWADELIYPYYDGLSLLNIAQSILAAFGAEHTRPLDADVWGGQLPDVDRVVLFITDGLGYQFLQDRVNDDDDLRQIVADLTQGRGALPLTSVAPSTTAVALPTFWSARPSQETGMLGTMLALREAAMLANILFFKPMVGEHPNGSLANFGMDAQTFVRQPSIAHQLEAHGVDTHLLLDYKLFGSGLSTILHRGVGQIEVHAGASDFWLRVTDMLSQTAGKRAYVNIYWPVGDTLSHLYGADTPYTRNEVKTQLQSLREVLKSPDVGDGRTLFMLCADHGHADAPNVITLDRDADARTIYDAMRFDFGAESRFAYLYLREGTSAQVIDTISRYYADSLTYVTRDQALQAGLFGGGAVHPEFHHRVGDLILLPRPGTRISDPTYRDRSVSVHGGLSAREMFVPFLWQVI